ncbi:metal-sensing transcriptional repressor [Parasedimentitalea maritima]|uniref:Metal-sensing transcriptional repressor n=1 Tax=Parasedimentitalea maritima TaxID=2578117 RepID=A0A5R8ZSE8_9RHOB|nr:metal-sensing transcriptional repressor [Zongyanglinia marina]KAE9632833.1 metal-sensing transcriptional repressor [Zongyanglinia marina]TLP69337.1 metal-sensing transcriptional repressor [Zongyanglinia marina]
MSQPHKHSSHPRISARLKRANGHLSAVIAMIADGRPCNDIAQQLQAVEKAITNAKRALIHDHIDHCLDPNDSDQAIDTKSFKDITRYL